VGPQKDVLDEVQVPYGKGQIFLGGGWVAQCNVRGDCSTSCAKIAAVTVVFVVNHPNTRICIAYAVKGHGQSITVRFQMTH